MADMCYCACGVEPGNTGPVPVGSPYAPGRTLLWPGTRAVDGRACAGSHVPRPTQGPRIGVPKEASVSFSWRSVSVPARIELVAQGIGVSLTSSTCLKRNSTSIPSSNQGQLSQDGLDRYDIHQRNLRSACQD